MRVVAKCDDEAVAARILDSEERIIRALLGDVIFGVDKQSMEVVVLDGLRRKGLTLAIAETVTGGLLASRMSDPTMEIFRGARIGRDSRESTQLTPEQRAAAAAVQVRSTFLATAIGDAQLAEKVILPVDRRGFGGFRRHQLAQSVAPKPGGAIGR